MIGGENRKVEEKTRERLREPQRTVKIERQIKKVGERTKKIN